MAIKKKKRTAPMSIRFDIGNEWVKGRLTKKAKQLKYKTRNAFVQDLLINATK